MSVRVLLILEDPTYDRYIVKPIAEKILQELGKPRAKVSAMSEPKMGGIEYVFDAERWGAILKKYSAMDLFVIVVDNDCEENRQQRVDALLTRIAREGASAVAAVAIQELEVWALAHYAGEIGVPWAAVREECHPKEVYFEPLCGQRRFSGPGKGRKAIMREVMGGFSGVRAKCVEIDGLKQRIAAALGD